MALGFALLACQPVHASPVNDGIICLQAQLNALDEGVGAVDGSYGGKTRAAAERLRGLDAFAGLPMLNGGNSMVLCRLIAEIDPTMAEHFRSSDLGAQAVYGDNMNRGTALLTKRYFERL